MIDQSMYLVRHGETANADGRLRGLADPDLNAAALGQAKSLASALASAGTSIIVSILSQPGVAMYLTGAAILGVLTGLALPPTAVLLAGTAAVGSYTTFSTWMLETHRLTEEHQHRLAALNLIASIALGVAAAGAGQWIGVHL
jgi:hypothetical protein